MKKKFNLLDLEGNVLKVWELDEEYENKLNCVFNNEYEDILKKNKIVYIGELPDFYIIENFKIKKITKEEAKNMGIYIESKSEVDLWGL